MGERDRGAIVQGLETLLSRGVDPARDGELLERFRAEGDPAAFEALVTRHGPMVRGVCRRLLRDDHDADDAFQATFLVLARKGTGLRDPDRLGPWLYGVASRVARKARVRSARRKGWPLTDDVPARDDARAEWSDVLPILDAELARLPSSQRDVLVACLLQGSSEQEAARAFACPVGTIKSRLSRAKEALRSRLVRRGVAPATALAAASSPGSFASSVSAPLLRATLSLVAAPAAVPRSVAALTSGVAPTMFSRALASTAALAGCLTIAGFSAVAWTDDPPTAGPATVGQTPPGDRDRLDGNLKNILLALHKYHEARGSLPPAAVSSAEGRPLLSWRVLILPYLDQRELYEQFHLDEPWDGPHNRELIAKMPAVYETPGHPAAAGKTRIQGVIDPGAIFGPRPKDGKVFSEGGQAFRLEPTNDPTTPVEKDKMRFRIVPSAGGIEFRDVTDGLSNTVMLVVSEDASDWTMPFDVARKSETIPMVSNDNVTGYRSENFWSLLDDGAHGYILGMADGSVRRLPPQPLRREVLLPALFSYAGGEVFDADKFLPPSEQVGRNATESPADARRTKLRNLARILLAIHDYRASQGDDSFPAAAIHGADGQPKLSWRVAILPFLGEEELFRQFHLDEPWDGPHNKALLLKMPALYETPDVETPVGWTRFRGFHGVRAMFDPNANFERVFQGRKGDDRATETVLDEAGRLRNRGVMMADVTDQSSRTALLGVAEEPEAWTQPGDLSFVLGGVPPALDVSDPRGLVLGMADGSIRIVPRALPAADLSALITRNGAEDVPEAAFGTLVPAAEINASQVGAAVMTPPAPQASTTARDRTPSAVATTDPGFEGRLQAVETKLDRILQRLDALAPKP